MTKVIKATPVCVNVALPISILTKGIRAAQSRNCCRRVAPVHFASGHQVLLGFPQHGRKVLVRCGKCLDAVLHRT